MTCVPKSVVADLFPKSVEAVVFPKSIVAQFQSIFSSSEPLFPMVDSFCTYQPVHLACTHILSRHSFMTLQVVVLPRLIEAGVFMNRLCIVFLSQLWLICSLSRFMSLFLLRRLWLNFYQSSRHRSRSYR